MYPLFIHSVGGMRERWHLAFPGAAVVDAVPAPDAPQLAAASSLWLDLAATPEAERLPLVAEAFALGKPLVVMVGTPSEAEAFSMMQSGAQGYCHVKAAPEQLREIALVVEHGGLWMPPELVQRFVNLSTRVVRRPVPEQPQLNDLTARELMVAEQVARGASNREIAASLDISERTVKAHLSSIFEKLGVRDRVQLALAMNNIPTYSTVN